MSTEILNYFAKRLLETRKSQGIKGNELAKIIQEKPTSITNWEQGKNFPRVETLVALAKALNVSIDWLLGVDTPSSNILNKPREIMIRDIPKPLMDATDHVVATEGYANVEELVRSLLREKTGVGQISSVSPRVRTAALQLVELAARTIPGNKPADGLQSGQEHQLVQGVHE